MDSVTEKMYAVLKEKWQELLLFAIWFVFVILLALFHEPWRDELQAYLLCRDLTLAELWKQNTYEGHLFCWFLMLKAAIAAGTGLAALPICSIGAMSIGSFFLVFYAPFSRITKIVILFSTVFLYIYPVIARPYALFPCILFVMAFLWKKRLERPWLFGFFAVLLANIHLIFEGMSLCLFLLALKDCYCAWKAENKKYLRSGIMIAFSHILGVGLAFLTIYSCIAEKVSAAVPPGMFMTFCQFISDLYLLQILDFRFALLPERSFMHFLYLILPAFFVLFLSFQKDRKRLGAIAVLTAGTILSFFILPFTLSLFLAFIACLSLFVIFPESRRSGAKILLATAIPMLYWFLFSAYIYPTRLARSLSFLVILIFFAWIFCDSGKEKENNIQKSLIALLFFSICNFLFLLYLELSIAFSPAYPMAKWVKKTLPKETFIAVEGALPDTFLAISAVTGKKVFLLLEGKEYTFYPRQKTSPKKLPRIPDLLIIAPDKDVERRSFYGKNYVRIAGFIGGIVASESSILYLREDLLKKFPELETR